MLVYCLKRIASGIPVLFLVSVLVFLMLYALPSDPVELMLSEVPTTKEAMETLRESLGLNDPMIVQYGRFLLKAIQGDFGRSIRSNRSVMKTIASQLRATLELAGLALALASMAGITAGIIAAVHRHTWLDVVLMLTSVVGVSMPQFWLGLLLIFFFSLRLGWLPATGQGGINRLILPALTLATSSLAMIARLTRSSLIDVLEQDYIRTAEAKGLRSRTVVLKHALRNSLIPTVTVVGLQIGGVISGTAVIETVFARQGVGHLLVDAIMFKDFPLVQGIVLLAALSYVMVNTLVDISYVFIDPRVRY